MQSLRNIIYKTWDKVLILLGVLCVLLPTSPLNMPLVYRDSGVFLYTGWRILSGELPYRDIWDHKPPVILYLNALGLAISEHSRWGVWLIEVILLFAAAFLGFQLIKRLFGVLPSVFSLMLWLLTLVFVLQGGNLTTEYTLPLQFAALFLVYHADRSSRPDWDFFLIGLTGAIAFFTKQTAIGTWIAIVIALTLQRLMSRQGRRWTRELMFLVLGGLTFSAIVILFFGLQGALPQFWSAAFEYNFAYASRAASSLTERLDAIVKGVRPLTRAWLFQLAMISYLLTIALILFRRNSVGKALTLLLIGLVALPIELILIEIPGRTFAHYYMTLLPVLALFCGVALWGILSLTPDRKFLNISKYVFVFFLAGIVLWNSFDGYLNQLYIYRDFKKNEPVIQFIKENTSPDDQVLLWGAETAINYFAQRKSPARFVYQLPLSQENYAAASFIDQFYDDVIQNQPKFIIDTDTNEPLYRFPITNETIEEKISYLEAHYCLVRRIDSWKIYEYSESGCSQ
ncbi:MAG TPA: glycosyltransferase family 39 protein [Anaerolineales bacterium]|nr:glycosyltransferase family 39 protein [Anaerolineales bacterium]